MFFRADERLIEKGYSRKRKNIYTYHLLKEGDSPTPSERKGTQTCVTSPNPSLGGVFEFARKSVITHFVIMHYELCIIH